MKSSVFASLVVGIGADFALASAPAHVVERAGARDLPFECVSGDLHVVVDQPLHKAYRYRSWHENDDVRSKPEKILERGGSQSGGSTPYPTLVYKFSDGNSAYEIEIPTDPSAKSKGSHNVFKNGTLVKSTDCGPIAQN